MERIERDIKAEAEKLSGLTFAELMDTFEPDEIRTNSILANKLLNVSNPDAPWVAFANLMGAWELAMGESYKTLQTQINTSLQLLMVLTGAKNQMQLLEYTYRLRKIEKQLPSMVRQIANGILGGQLAVQNQAPILVPSAPQSAPGGGTQSNPATAYTVYPWNKFAKMSNGPIPRVFGGILLRVDGAQLASIADNSIGVAVSVDAQAQTVTVASNGQQINDIDPTLMSGLSFGDELLPSVAVIGGRNLITVAEALANGIVAGSPVKTIARVLKNDNAGHSIVILDRAITPLPTG